MSAFSGPSNVTSGLVFSYDMSNRNKSWLGYPTTNQFTLPTSATNGFGVQNSTFTRVYAGTYGGYDIQPTDYVWQYNINGNDCPYHGWDITTPSGTVVTFSFDYYVSPSTVGYPSNNYLANMENAGSGVSGGYSDPTPSITGVWKRGYFSSTASATGLSRCLLYPGACGTQLATGTGFILYKNPQVEFNAPGSMPTPFVAGTRSTTQAIIDLTGKNTLTASSLTYESGGEFNFNGTGNYIDVTGAGFTSGMTGYTIMHWSRRDVESRMPVAGRTSTAFYQYGDNSWYYTHGGVAAEYYYPHAVSIPVGTWGFYCIVYDGSYVKIYRNGIFEGQQATTGTADWSQGLKIGYWSAAGGYAYSGKIGSVKFYNRGLSATEVTQEFNALRGRYGL